MVYSYQFAGNKAIQFRELEGLEEGTQPEEIKEEAERERELDRELKFEEDEIKKKR